MSASFDPGAHLSAALERQRALTAGRTLTGTTHNDANDDHGTIATDDAIAFDPLGLLGVFDQFQTGVVIIGQVAASCTAPRNSPATLICSGPARPTTSRQ